MSSNQPGDKARPSQRIILLTLAVAVVAALVIVLVIKSIGSPGEASPQTSSVTSDSATAAPQSSVSSTPSIAASIPAATIGPEAQEAKTGSPSDPALAQIPQKSLAPIPMNSAAVIDGKVTANIVDVKAVDGVAKGKGQIAGASIQVQVQLKNKTAQSISTSEVSVSAEYGDAAWPAERLSGPGQVLFPETIPSSQTASAVFVFAVPDDQRQSVRIFVSYQASSPIAVFSGAAPQSQGSK